MQKELTAIFENNLGNRITAEVANGMLQSIFTLIDSELKDQKEKIKKELNLEGPEDVQSTNTNNG